MKELNLSLSLRALLFASDAHCEQKRKYTHEPYINHPIEVAAIVCAVTGDEEMIAAAYLHDVVEDCGVKLSEIEEKFGPEVAKLVEELTDVSKPEDGNRQKRKELDRLHLAKASPRAKTIKLADLISNTRSIKEHDPDFAKIYLAEKEKLLAVLTEGDRSLYKIALSYLG